MVDTNRRADDSGRMARWKRPAAWLTLAFVVLQAAWILTVPPFRGSDEFDQAFRAAAVAGGQWVAEEPARDGRGLLVEVPSSLAEAARAQCSELKYTGPDNCNAVRETDGGNVLIASAAARYFPGYYYVVGTPALQFDGSGALYAMRVLTALICAVFFAAAAWACTRPGLTWATVALVAAASPVLVYSASIAAPNGVEMAAALALWSSLLSLARSVDRREQRALLLIAVASASVMCLLRLLGPFFVVAIVATVVLSAPRDLLERLRQHTRLAVAGSVIVALSAGTFVAWITGPGSSPDPSAAGDGGEVGLIHALLWPLQTIAAFPYRNQPGPLIIYGVVGAVVALLVGTAVQKATAWRRTVILGALVASLLLPFAATYATAGDLGNIWQGRYGLPFAVGFILLAGFTLDGTRTGRLHPWALWSVLVAYGAALVACYVKVRDAEVRDNPASVGDPAWHEPSTLLVVGLVALAVLCLGVAASEVSLRRARQGLTAAAVSE